MRSRRRSRHFCNSIAVEDEAIPALLASGEVSILVIPKANPSLPVWVCAKRPDRIRPEEQEYVVEGPTALEALEANRLRLARCGQQEDRFHLYYTERERTDRATADEARREALLR